MIVKILASIFSAYYFINIAGIPNKIKQMFKFKPGQRLKPFDCIYCLSAWVGLSLYFLPNQVSEAMLIMFVSGYISSKLK